MYVTSTLEVICSHEVNHSILLRKISGLSQYLSYFTPAPPLTQH